LTCSGSYDGPGADQDADRRSRGAGGLERADDDEHRPRALGHGPNVPTLALSWRALAWRSPAALRVSSSLATRVNVLITMISTWLPARAETSLVSVEG
jgi:hypothetical protein